MPKNKDLQLTSVRVHKDVFEEFKIKALRYKFSFQKLADRSMFLYLTDEEFRRKLHNQIDLKLPDEFKKPQQ